MTEAPAIPEEVQTVESPAPAMMQVDEEATRMVQQAVTDYIARLEPAARAATDGYFRQVLPRTRVLFT